MTSTATTRSLKVTAGDRETAVARGRAGLISSFPNLVVTDIVDSVKLEDSDTWLITGEVRDRELEDAEANLDEKPRAPERSQLKRIEALSDEILGNSQAVFGLIGYPATHAEAQLTLSALGKLISGHIPRPGPETNLINRIREKADLPDPDPEPAVPEPASGEASRRCSRCRQTKTLKDFPANPRTKDGYDYRCQDCTTSSPAKTGDPNSAVNRRKVRKSAGSARAKTPAPKATTETSSVTEAWREVFANPTFTQLEAFRAFLAEAGLLDGADISLDEAARICRVIAGPFAPKDRT